MSAGPSPAPPAWLRSGVTAAGWVVAGLGRHRYRVADAIGNLAFACQPQRRTVTARNFERALGPIGARRARRLAAACYRSYARTAVDFLYVQGRSRVQVAAMTRVVGMEHLQRSAARGRGGILVLVHHGSWDVAGAAAAAHGYAVTSVMDEGSQALLTALVVWSRARAGVRVTTPSRGPAELVRTLARRGWVALLADLPGDTPSVEVPFFGRRSRFSSAPGLLAARTGAPVHAVVCARVPDGHYLIEIHPPVLLPRAADPAAALGPLLPTFEAAIRRSPEQWFPFGSDRFLDGPRDGRGPAG